MITLLTRIISFPPPVNCPPPEPCTRTCITEFYVCVYLPFVLWDFIIDKMTAWQIEWTHTFNIQCYFYFHFMILNTQKSIANFKQKFRNDTLSVTYQRMITMTLRDILIYDLYLYIIWYMICNMIYDVLGERDATGAVVTHGCVEDPLCPADCR